MKPSIIMTGLKQVIIARNDLNLGKGKLAAQVAHASLLAALEMKEKNNAWFEQWMQEGMKKIVLKVESQEELGKYFNEIKKEFPAAMIKDAGLTQLTPGTATCIGFGPVPEEKADKHTKNLKLL